MKTFAQIWWVPFFLIGLVPAIILSLLVPRFYPNSDMGIGYLSFNAIVSGIIASVAFAIYLVCHLWM